MVIPPALQVKNFGVNFGGVKKGVIDAIKAAGFDSWLTVGLTDGSSGLGSAGINWKAWTDKKGINSKDCGVFWMNPSKTTAKGTVTVAQLTIKAGTKTSVMLGIAGQNTNGKNWRVNRVQFVLSSSTCKGDLNGSNKIDIEDLLIVLSNYGKSGKGVKGDLNGSNKVDIEDLLIVLSNYGKIC